MIVCPKTTDHRKATPKKVSFNGNVFDKPSKNDAFIYKDKNKIQRVYNISGKIMEISSILALIEIFYIDGLNVLFKNYEPKDKPRHKALLDGLLNGTISKYRSNYRLVLGTSLLGSALIWLITGNIPHKSKK